MIAKSVILKENIDFKLDSNGVAIVASPFYQEKIVMFPEGITKIEIPTFRVDEDEHHGYIVPFMAKKIILPNSAIEFNGNDIASKIDTNNIETFKLSYSAYINYVSDFNMETIIPVNKIIPSQLMFNKNIKQIRLVVEGQKRTTTEICFSETPINHVSVFCSFVESEATILLNLRNVYDYSLRLELPIDKSHDVYKIYAYDSSIGQAYAEEHDIPFVSLGPSPFVETLNTNQETI